MNQRGFIMSLAIFTCAALFVVGFIDGLPPKEQAAQKTPQEQREERRQVMLHSCSINGVVQAQEQLCRNLAAIIRQEADAEQHITVAGAQ